MLTSVPARYEHGQIILAEVPANIQSPEVLVTFHVAENKKTSKRKREGYGMFKGLIQVPKDFNEPMEDLDDYM